MKWFVNVKSFPDINAFIKDLIFSIGLTSVDCDDQSKATKWFACFH